jgi:formylglycine-generating enzyme required for sulfatase activity
VVRHVLLLSLLSVVVLFGGCASANKGGWDNVDSSIMTKSAMKLIPGGTFQMGSESQDVTCSGCSWGEQPVHSVTLSPFYMDTTEVTQGDFKSCMRVNPSNFQESPRNPVEMVTWYDAVLYCNARSKREGFDTVYQYTALLGQPRDGSEGEGCRKLLGFKIDLSRNGYRLPTEAEWEYACRAGTTTEFFWGRNYLSLTDKDSLSIDSNAVWFHSLYVYRESKLFATLPVASKKPNAWGLYDMAGNVWEWCHDYNGEYSAEAQTDPAGPDTANSRILRGGSWCDHIDSYNYRFLRSAFRSSDFPDSRTSFRGFRCVRRP